MLVASAAIVVSLSLVFWGSVWGPVGMIISVPLTMIARIVLEHWDESHWLVVLLGPAPSADPPRPRIDPAGGDHS